MDTNTEQNRIRPEYYGGSEDPYEAIKVIEAWELGFHLGNALKYIRRAGKKEGQAYETDLAKAIWYLRRAAENSIAFRKEAAQKAPSTEGPPEVRTWR